MNVAGPQDPAAEEKSGEDPGSYDPPGDLRSSPEGPRLALESQTWTVEPRCQSSRKSGALQCRRPDCGTQVAGGSAAGALGEQREIMWKPTRGAGVRRPHFSGAILRGPSCVLPPAGDRGASGKSLHRAAAAGSGLTPMVKYEWRMGPLGTQPRAWDHEACLRPAQRLQWRLPPRGQSPSPR